MNWKSVAKLGVVGALALAAQGASAALYTASYDHLIESATIGTTINVGDALAADTFVTTEVGALLQTTTFTLGAGVNTFSGFAAWEISNPGGSQPRLIGVNLDIFDSGNNLVATDAFVGVLGGFAHSTFGGNIGPGTYTLVATGTGVRASSMDISLEFAHAVPEAGTYGMMIGGLGMLAFLIARRRIS